MLTDAEIAAALELCAKATPGEWEPKWPVKESPAVGIGDCGIVAATTQGPLLIGEFFGVGNASWTMNQIRLPTSSNNTFACAAHSEKTGWPAALREVQRLRKQLEAARLSLKHTAPLSAYADELASAGMVYGAHTKALRVTSRKANEALAAIAALEDET